jgi:hypothetical protein
MFPWSQNILGRRKSIIVDVHLRKNLSSFWLDMRFHTIPNTFSDDVSPLRGSIGGALSFPMADAMGYRSFAAPRLDPETHRSHG